MWLKQSSTGTFIIGPFVDNSDGATPKTALTIAQADVRLSKNGTAFAQKNEATSASHVEAGYYSVPYNATDTNTLGILKLSVTMTGTALPVWADFMVLPANVFNSIVWNTEVLGVNALNTGTVSTLANSIGNPIALDGGTATIAGMLTKFADDSNGTIFDATSDSLHSLATSIAASAPVAAVAVTGTCVTGIVVSGNFSNTSIQNNIYWQLGTTGTSVIDATLTYAVGTGKLANTLRVIGRYQVSGSTSGKYVSVQAYNYKTSTYDTISATSTRINGQTASTDNTYTYALTVDYLSTAGAAIIRFVGSDTTATSNLYLDYVPYLYQTVGTTTDAIAQAVYLKMRNTVYEGGVWIDTVYGVAGTVIGDNGTSWNPVNTLADALTIANTLGVKRLYFKPDSEITLNQSFANWRFIGRGKVHLGNQDISDAWFQQLEFVDGLSTGSDAIFQQCIMGSGSFYPTWFDRCALAGSVTFRGAGEYTFEGCYDGSPSTSINPTFIFTSGALAGFRGWNGGIALSTMVAGNYATIEGMGRVVIDSNCSGGNITVRGFFPSVTDNVPGGFAGTLTDTQRYGEDQNTYAITNGWVQHSGTVVASSVTGNVSGSVNSVVNPVTASGVVSITGTVDANIVAISGDIPAADNLETMLDGTGGNNLSLNRLIINNTTPATSAVKINSVDDAIDIDAVGVAADIRSSGNKAIYVATTSGNPAHHVIQLDTLGDSDLVRMTGEGGNGLNIAMNSGTGLLFDVPNGNAVYMKSSTGTGLKIEGQKGITVQAFSPDHDIELIGDGILDGSINGKILGSGTGTFVGVGVQTNITGTVDANIVSSNNIDFTALQKTSLNSSTPASVGSVTGNVIGSVGSVLSPVTVVGYVNVTGTVQAIVLGYVQVTGTVDANVEKWNTVDVVSGAIPAFVAGTAGGIPTVDLNNYIAGIQGTKNQLDDLHDIAAGTQMDLVNAPNALAVTVITNDVFNEVVEGTTNFKTWIRRIGAALFGKANGGGAPGSKKFRDTTDTVNRIDATTDANGNRTSVTFDDTDT